MKARDKKEYRHKGLRKNTIKTIMGEVEYRRTMYEGWKKDDKRNRRNVYKSNKKYRY